MEGRERLYKRIRALMTTDYTVTGGEYVSNYNIIGVWKGDRDREVESIRV